MIAAVREAMRRERAWLDRTGHRGPLPPASYLAISGGGDSGAFGAGLLTGWTAAGTRPTFKVVTGVSTGALIAPFAFLGSDHDWALRTYTEISGRNIFRRRAITALFFSDALSDTGPMRRLIARMVTPEFLRAVGAEYEKGRLLLIGTTDLDARRPVIWNMTAIAASNDPEALELFRDILVASAAVPGAFPPVMIEVEADGRRYQEMHVDGGAAAQVFLYPPSVDVAALGPVRERRAYIIRNARLDPEWASVDRRALSIMRRAVSTLMQTQGEGDLFMMYATTQRDGVDYNLAYIPAEFDTPHTREFDPVYMNSLYEFAYRLGSTGNPWHKAPPNVPPSRLGERLY
jgi:predicted acylesterase/phospholipase RssA